MITNIKYCLLICFVLLFTEETRAQSTPEIPIGTWRAHLSFKQAKKIAVSPSHVYAASNMGILVFDKTDNSLSSLTKLSGLSSSGISSIAYDPQTQQLLVMYADGNLDVVSESTVINFPVLKDAEITEPKSINHASFRNGLAYLSTAYGIVVFDMTLKEIRETWRRLGSDGSNLAINETLFIGDSIFAATNKGVIKGNIQDNLLDYSLWIRLDEGNLDNPISSISNFQNKIYLAIDTLGIHVSNGSTFVNSGLLVNKIFNNLNSTTDHLSIATTDGLWSLNANNELIQITDDKIQQPADVFQEENDVYWIADGENGLVSNLTGSFTAYLPNGPLLDNVRNLVYADHKVFTLQSRFHLAEDTTDQTSIFYFENGLWSTASPPINKITDIVTFSHKTFWSSWGMGLVQQNADGSIIHYNETNSPLQESNSETAGILVPAIQASESGVWVLNYGVQPFLHLLKPDGTWTSYSSSNFNTQYALELVIDPSGYVWLKPDQTLSDGLIVFDPETLASNIRNNVIGTGGLLNNTVRSIALDRDGNMWAGTDGGLGFFYSPTVDAVIPIYEGRFLLRDEKITAIAVDGGNRKWLGTENGVWLFDATGEKLIYNFTAENSPLLSNVVYDIEINSESGEVFFATSNGLVSFRAGATSSTEEFEHLKIFPNPVTASFNGSIGISGLSTDAFVKITDVSGKLIWQGQAQGGTATWNTKDYKGNRAKSGIYLVFASSVSGSEKVVGKIAVID